jgi:tRNA-dihydrouridine synthase B
MWNTREINIGGVIIPTRVFSAPMAGISNIAIRLQAKEHGAGLVYTEMVSAEAVIRNNIKSLKIMAISPNEHPVALQLFGHNPDALAEASAIAGKEADIIDINFGCPAKTVVNSGNGSALMKSPELIREIVNKSVKIAQCPITAKIRSGWDKDSINAIEIAKIIEDCGASAVAIHPRTRSQGFAGMSDWSIIAEVKNNVSIPVIGNGDIYEPEDAKAMLDMTGCDAIMIGRGALGNPWLFSRTLTYLETGILIDEPSNYEKLTQLMKFAKMLVDVQGEYTACREIRKFIKWYTKGMKNITEMRCQAMHVESLQELTELIKPHIEIAEKEEFTGKIVSDKI